MTELLGCPFCGGEGRTSKFTAVVVRQPWRALCMNDDCPMELHCDFSTEAEAIAAWETRAALAQPARAQAGVFVSSDLAAQFVFLAKVLSYAEFNKPNNERLLVLCHAAFSELAEGMKLPAPSMEAREHYEGLQRDCADTLAALGGEDG